MLETHCDQRSTSTHEQTQGGDVMLETFDCDWSKLTGQSAMDDVESYRTRNEVSETYFGLLKVCLFQPVAH